ncbi:alpha/beta fold hydrolase [Wenxinia marina]|nr:alpha/beta hydrolase [Wenxinia marina]
MRAPLFEDVADAPEGGVAAWVATMDGVTIRVAAWGHGAPKGTVLIFPGRTEYVEKYGGVAGELLARGYASAVVDWRGQGISGRVHRRPAHGHVAAFRDYQADVAALLRFVRDEGLPQPLYLLAHSMGGCIGLRALTGDLPVRAAAFSAPMWGLNLTPSRRGVAWSLSTLSRTVGLSGVLTPGQLPESYILSVGFEENALTTHRESFQQLVQQLRAHPELALGGPTLRWLNEALREMRGLAARPSPRVPVVAFLGTEEAIVDPGRIHRRMADWPGGRLEMIDGARHEVLMEGPRTRGRILDAAVELFAAHG